MSLVKNFTLSLILVVAFSIAIMSVSAAPVDDNTTDNANALLSVSNFNKADYDFGGLNFDDYSTNDDFQDDTGVNNTDINRQKSYNEDLDVVKKSNSQNDITKVEDLINVKDMIHMGDYTLNQTSDNTYTLTLADKTTLTVSVIQIKDLDSFKSAVDNISKNDVAFDAVVFDFMDNLNLDISPWTNDLIKMGHVKNLIIRGNSATISVKNPDKGNEYHFADVNSDATLWMSNITISGFNTAIYNHGTSQYNHVIFSNNGLDYISDEDYGGAVRNYGVLKCYECSFINNYAKYGGAIYNQKGSQTSLTDCYFNRNTGYGGSKSSLRTNDNTNIYTSKGATCLVFNHNDEAVLMNINSMADYGNLQHVVESLGNVRFLVLNFTCPEIYDARQTLTFKNVENLYIYGNGAKINVLNPKSSDECKFLELTQGQFCSIENLTVAGFNTAISNQGSIAISNSIFKDNKIDYTFKRDFGGAVYNDEGIMSLSNSLFENNYAKHGGAIYNYNGIITAVDTVFSCNKVYGDGGALYNDVGLMLLKDCTLISNYADDKGGSVMNHYGLISFNNVSFSRSHANDYGGAIYNDFGEILVNNSTFTLCTSEEGNEIYNYGAEAKCSILGNSSVIENTKAGLVTKQIKTVDDAPSEVLRWVLRIAEIGLCVALTVAAGFIPNPFLSFVVGFVGGALLSGAEEFAEGYFLDHNFNVYNCLAMMVVAGLFDGTTSALGSILGKTAFKQGGAIALKLGANTAKVQGIVTAGIELVGEVLTEVIPRFDFTNYDVPSTVIPKSYNKVNLC